MEEFINECNLVIECILFGFVVAVFFDIVKSMIFVGKRHYKMLGVFEIIFCVVAGFEWFNIVFEYNGGVIKVFYVAAVFIGIFFYDVIFGKSVRKIFSDLSQDVYKIIVKK